MAYSTKSIPFFTDEIELDVHSATHAHHLGHTSIKYFAEWVYPEPIRLEQRNDNNEFIVSSGAPGSATFAFMAGPEI